MVFGARTATGWAIQGFSQSEAPDVEKVVVSLYRRLNYSDPFGLCPDPKDPSCKYPDDQPIQKVTADVTLAKAALSALNPEVGAVVEGLSLVGSIYHRLESPTQTPETARAQQESGQLWGYPRRGSDIPSVKAYTGALPSGARGVQFMTDVLPDRGTPPGAARWTGPRPGVTVEQGRAIICAVVNKNTQC